MCKQLTERYAVCGCHYHTHALDPCGLAGTMGHQVEQREISVGYVCERHETELPPGYGHTAGSSRGATSNGGTRASAGPSRGSGHGQQTSSGASSHATSSDSGYGSGGSRRGTHRR